jgi:dihydroneopterin aldolase
MDSIFISDLRVETIVGIWDWERRMPQTVSLDLEMAADISRAAETESIDDTLDYRSVAKRVSQFIVEAEFKLVETMAEQVADVIRSEFSVPWVRVTVRKPFAVRGSKDVGVTIERGG